MNLRRALLVWTLVLVTTAILGLPLGTWASHRWGCWKYADANSWHNFTVVDGLKGEKDGSTVSIERVSSTQGDSVAFFNFDGGNFEVGGSYLLFLKRQEDGGPFYYQINDQGRFHDEGGHLRAVEPDDPVAAQFHGRPVAEGVNLVKKNK